MEYSDTDMPSPQELIALYDSVQWRAYTRDPAQLARGVAGSLRVITARRAGQLVGLARIVGDGASIAYLQDILVSPLAQRSGVGRELFTRAFAPFAAVRQQVLLTDDEPGQRAFYEAMGFTEIRDITGGGVRAFMRTN